MRSWPDGSADAIRVRYTTDAAALRTDHDGGVVWQREGSLVEVIDGLLTLPPPSAPGAPRLVTVTHPPMWIPKPAPQSLDPMRAACFQDQETIDAEAFYDYVLAHAPEFARGRQKADEVITRGELGKPLTEVAADLEAEERGDRRSA